MSNSDPTGTNWTEQEIDWIVADYFDMLGMDLSGQSFVKAHRNSELQKQITRSKGSIEYKHQNISAILLKLGMPWIQGYKPASNYQTALVDGVERYLQKHQEMFTGENCEVSRYTPELVYVPPPAKTPSEPKETKAIKRLIGKFDPVQRDARNRALGRQGEKYILQSERVRLDALGLTELSSKVRWVSEVDGDGAGYDIRSFSENGEERLLEVKTTSGHLTTQFYLSENERSLSVERPNEFRLVRLYDFPHAPKVFVLKPPLEDWVTLQPLNYRAFFESRGNQNAKIQTRIEALIPTLVHARGHNTMVKIVHRFGQI